MALSDQQLGLNELYDTQSRLLLKLRLKEHEIAALVNKVTRVAFHAGCTNQQLRIRISEEVTKYLTQLAEQDSNIDSISET